MDQNSAFKLPADLVMHVLEFLDPIDILAMRATCRTFYRLAASRSVWIAALNRVCEQHGIYKPTYPMEKMTLAELERAASGSHRFIRFVNKSDTMPPAMWPQPYPTRQFHWRTKSSEAGKPDRLHSVSQLAMVPGGRFLVTTQNAVNDTTTGIACLWDLGYDMYTPLTPFPIATMTAPSNVRALAACPSLNGKDIIVAMYGSKRPSAECFLKICSISPLHRKPEFVVHLEQQQLPPSRTRPSIRLNEPIVLVKADSAILVWNWANGTGCRWDYTSLDHGAEILLCGNTLVAIDKSHDFVIWDIPERLSPIIPQQGPPSITNPPKRIRRMHVTETNLPRFSTAVTPSWQRHTDPYFCFLVDERDNAGYGNLVCLHSLRRIWSHVSQNPVPAYKPGKPRQGCLDL